MVLSVRKKTSKMKSAGLIVKFLNVYVNDTFWQYQTELGCHFHQVVVVI